MGGIRSFHRNGATGSVIPHEVWAVAMKMQTRMSGFPILMPVGKKKIFIGMFSIPTAVIRTFGPMGKSIMVRTTSPERRTR